MRTMTLRRWLFVAGILPALLVIAYSVKVGLMLAHASDGRDLFDDGEYGAAAGEFGANRSLNLFESWVAAFDEGAARHAAGEHDAAVTAYTAALDDVPAEEECTVRINLALAHEAIGDAALEPEQADPPAAPDPSAAVESWQAGIDTLAEGDCPTDSGRGEEQTADAAAVDERLRDKLEQQEAGESGEEKDPQQEPQQQPDDKESESKERKLERRNEAGTTERRRDLEREGELGLDGPTW